MMEESEQHRQASNSFPSLSISQPSATLQSGSVCEPMRRHRTVGVVSTPPNALSGFSALEPHQRTRTDISSTKKSISSTSRARTLPALDVVPTDVVVVKKSKISKAEERIRNGLYCTANPVRNLLLVKGAFLDLEYVSEKRVQKNFEVTPKPPTPPPPPPLGPIDDDVFEKGLRFMQEDEAGGGRRGEDGHAHCLVQALDGDHIGHEPRRERGPSNEEPRKERAPSASPPPTSKHYEKSMMKRADQQWSDVDRSFAAFNTLQLLEHQQRQSLWSERCLFALTMLSEMETTREAYVRAAQLWKASYPVVEVQEQLIEAESRARQILENALLKDHRALHRANVRLGRELHVEIFKRRTEELAIASYQAKQAKKVEEKLHTTQVRLAKMMRDLLSVEDAQRTVIYSGEVKDWVRLVWLRADAKHELDIQFRASQYDALLSGQLATEESELDERFKVMNQVEPDARYDLERDIRRQFKALIVVPMIESGIVNIVEREHAIRTRLEDLEAEQFQLFIVGPCLTEKIFTDFVLSFPTYVQGGGEVGIAVDSPSHYSPSQDIVKLLSAALLSCLPMVSELSVTFDEAMPPFNAVVVVSSSDAASTTRSPRGVHGRRPPKSPTQSSHALTGVPRSPIPCALNLPHPLTKKAPHATLSMVFLHYTEEQQRTALMTLRVESVEVLRSFFQEDGAACCMSLDPEILWPLILGAPSRNKETNYDGRMNGIFFSAPPFLLCPAATTLETYAPPRSSPFYVSTDLRIESGGGNVLDVRGNDVRSSGGGLPITPIKGSTRVPSRGTMSSGGGDGASTTGSRRSSRPVMHASSRTSRTQLPEEEIRNMQSETVERQP